LESQRNKNEVADDICHARLLNKASRCFPVPPIADEPLRLIFKRAFVRLRDFLATHRELADKLKELEQKFGAQDQQIQTIFDAIHQLMAAPKTNRRPLVSS
jgi:hypothetical protein